MAFLGDKQDIRKSVILFIYVAVSGLSSFFMILKLFWSGDLGEFSLGVEIEAIPKREFLVTLFPEISAYGQN